MERGHRSVAYLSAVHRSEWSHSRLAGLKRVFDAVGLHKAVKPFTNESATIPVDYLDGYNPQEELARILTPLINQGCDATTAMVLQTIVHSERYLEVPLEKILLEEPMEQLMERALVDKTITAWVAANDNAAMACLKFLRRRRIRVPSTIAVIGFDDTFEAFNAGLTSYNFNLEAAVDVSLKTLVEPRTVPPAPKNGALEIEGHIVERKSTALWRIP